MVTDLPERYYLAALTHSVGRAGAVRETALRGTARAAFAQVCRPRADPRLLQRQCVAHGIDLLSAGDRGYPALLRDIADPPPVLYARGDTGALLRPAVAIVGARRCTRTGAEVAAALGRTLAACGVCVVSGLARGIDTAAHRAAVAAGVSVAVIGSGLAKPYPSANRTLADSMVAGGGLLLSEYPPWHGARRHHFPERNRLISGIALGVVVVEAGKHSGSLITARMAAEQGRDVCAVPGPVTSPMSHGCHRLLKQGAALVERAEDVLEVLGLTALQEPDGPQAQQRHERRPDSRVLANVLAAVEGTLTPLDSIVDVTGLAVEAASAALVELELGGFVRQVPGGYIRRPLT